MALRFAELTVDDPREDEVLVRIAATGCARDAHTRAGRIRSPLPAVLGHEGAGVVAAVVSAVSHLSAFRRGVVQVDDTFDM
ncbi:alcohol dehydrogenase catalytic domain-containing protein [Pseudonocardia parietis]|uniref:alcohol dehydrogenase n=1 Tax=Pseudonocardia parietis TaxID=570936 RepID=A0ABS4W6E0_9PSEU|nr:alcohol dehydrogenase catalytic domain-containing protein [Pseudonocardia parietis]MBP2371787.1 Zn-dependent alcohol dehydrogenase [Pseudonocardia parietis]